MVADEVVIVTEHQQKVARPHYHYELHKRNYTGMSGHSL